MLLYGTRPQVIKASALRRALAGGWSVCTVDTGQHYDYALNRLLYEQLGVAEPDHFLEVGSGSHAAQTGAVLERAEALLLAARPDVAVVIGDTNSTLGAALAAAKLRIPVVHVEAGLRASDALMAEEINRRAVDAISQVLCAPSATAEARLRRERVDGTIVRTGDVARDVLLMQRDRLTVPEGLTPGGYLFATLHRAELTDQPVHLLGVLRALAALPLPVVFAIHPRTRAALERAGSRPDIGGALRVVPAVGYLECLAHTAHAAAVVTDSGGVQREAYWLGAPCVTLRTETEWPETVAFGANRTVAPAQAPDVLGDAVEAALAGPRAWDRDAYGSGDAARRVVEAMDDLRGGVS